MSLSIQYSTINSDREREIVKNATWHLEGEDVFGGEGDIST